MLEVTGNLWTYGNAEAVRCITTNGFVKNNGLAVMGRGCALEAAKKFPSLPRLLAAHLRQNGNVLGEFDLSAPDPVRIITFPVKHIWVEPADPVLIQRSAEALSVLAIKESSSLFILPRPGCGNGQLTWVDVRPLLKFLPDNVLVITNHG